MPLESGACSQLLTVWGYNSNTNLCEEFLYTGCLGNLNRFATQAECQARCEGRPCLQNSLTFFLAVTTVLIIEKIVFFCVSFSHLRTALAGPAVMVASMAHGVVAPLEITQMPAVVVVVVVEATWMLLLVVSAVLYRLFQ